MEHVSNAISLLLQNSHSQSVTPEVIDEKSKRLKKHIKQQETK